VQGKPADLRAVLSWIDARAESRGHQLRTQADAERRLAGGQALGDAGDFIGEKRVLLLLVDPDGPAENDQQLAGLRLRQGKMRRGGLDGFEVEAALPQRRFKRTEIFKGQVAEYDGSARGSGHRTSLNGKERGLNARCSA